MSKRNRIAAPATETQLSHEEVEKRLREQGDRVRVAEKNYRRSPWEFGDAVAQFKQLCWEHEHRLISDEQIAEELQLDSSGQRVGQVRNTAEYFPEHLRDYSRDFKRYEVARVANIGRKEPYAVEELAQMVRDASSTDELRRRVTEKPIDPIEKRQLAVSVICRPLGGVWDVLNPDVDYDGVRHGHRPEENLPEWMAALPLIASKALTDALAIAAQLAWRKVEEAQVDPGGRAEAYGRHLAPLARQLREVLLRNLDPQRIDGHNADHDLRALQIVFGCDNPEVPAREMQTVPVVEAVSQRALPA